MPQRERLGMERRPRDQRRRPPVDRITQHRVMNVGEVDAHLVGAAGFERDLEERVAAGEHESPEVGNGGFSADNNRHSLPVFLVAANRGVDLCRGVAHLTDDDRPVLTLHHSLLQLAGQSLVRYVVLGNHKQSRRVAIQAMNDARALGTADRRPVRAAAEKPMYERSRGMTGTGVNDKPGRFVYHREILVLVHNPQLHRLALQRTRSRRRNFPRQPVAAAQSASGTGGPVVDPDLALADQSLDPAAAEPTEKVSQVHVEAGRIGSDGVALSRTHTIRVRQDRTRLPTRRTATPTEMAESATLKIG